MIAFFYSYHLLRADRWPVHRIPKRLPTGHAPGNTGARTSLQNRWKREGAGGRFLSKLWRFPKCVSFASPSLPLPFLQMALVSSAPFQTSSLPSHSSVSHPWQLNAPIWRPRWVKSGRALARPPSGDFWSLRLSIPGIPSGLLFGPEGVVRG